MQKLRWLVVPAVLVLIAGACSKKEEDGAGGGQQANKGTVNVLNATSADESAALQALVDKMISPNVDYKIEMEYSDQFEEQFQIRAEAGTLDLILLPQPGALPPKAQSGGAVSLEDMGFDIDELNSTFGDYYMSLGEVDGKHYGFPTNANLKSMIWYPKDDFDEAGYTVPETWDDLMALTDQIKSDGGTPWCVGFESGTATGWPATDWMEDIMLKTAGVDVYQQWATHQIPFNDPAVVHAGQLFGDVMFPEGNVLGGAANTVNLAFGDAPAPMFKEPKPGCWLHHQATFITAFFNQVAPDAKAGVDYDWFPTPPIDQDNALFGGELAVAFSNRPEIVDFLKRFSAEDVQCAMGGDPALGRLSPRVDVPADCYQNPILGQASEVVSDALANGTGGFDAGDQMPAEVGSGSFWTGMVNYMKEGPSSLEAVLEDIDKSWPS